MRDHNQPGDLPLRPLTTGELLDAAVVLLRVRGSWMIGLGITCALIEQAALYPLRRLADIDASFLPGDTRLREYGWLVVIGLATEALSIGWLGGAAASLVPRALLGPAASKRTGRLPGIRVLLTTVAGALLVGATGWPFLVLPEPLQLIGILLSYLVTAMLWPLAYGLVGLAAPAVVIDGLGPVRALLRSLRLASRTTMRAVWIRVLGYTVWLFIRLAMGLGSVYVVGLVFQSPSNTVDDLIMGGAWLLVNALAYPMLGCLDAALHLDVRMRTEGLDIALRRAVRRGVATDAALAVPR